jgi:hypothetical protein
MKSIEKTSSMIVDVTTGEVIEERNEIITKDFKIVKNVEEFWFMYASFVSLMVSKDVNSLASVKIFYWILKEYPGVYNEIPMTGIVIERMSKELGYSKGSIKNTIPILIELKLLIKRGRGLFVVNPEYVFKGYMKDRNQLLVNIQLLTG